MKHPENVEALILASPVGMGEKRILDSIGHLKLAML